MDKKLKQMKKDYMNTPIPAELDLRVKQALGQQKRKNRVSQWLIAVGAASVILVGSINSSATIAMAFSDVPVVGDLVKVLTFREYHVDEDTYQANIKVPAVEDMENQILQSSLNEKYLEENKKLYDQFISDMEQLKEQGGGYMGVDSGYEVKTDNEKILSIGRYVVNTVASSSTTYQFDTIDKQNQVLVTLPSLFKDESYVEVISEHIKEQMIEQMKADPSKSYWVEYPGGPELFGDVGFETIKHDQNFYITEDHKLVISFDKYDVAPGYMGVVEFVIPTETLSDVLVSDEYIQ